MVAASFLKLFIGHFKNFYISISKSGIIGWGEEVWAALICGALFHALKGAWVKVFGEAIEKGVIDDGFSPPDVVAGDKGAQEKGCVIGHVLVFESGAVEEGDGACGHVGGWSEDRGL